MYAVFLYLEKSKRLSAKEGKTPQSAPPRSAAGTTGSWEQGTQDGPPVGLPAFCQGEGVGE